MLSTLTAHIYYAFNSTNQYQQSTIRITKYVWGVTQSNGCIQSVGHYLIESIERNISQICICIYMDMENVHDLQGSETHAICFDDIVGDARRVRG